MVMAEMRLRSGSLEPGLAKVAKRGLPGLFGALWLLAKNRLELGEHSILSLDNLRVGGTGGPSGDGGDGSKDGTSRVSRTEEPQEVAAFWAAAALAEQAVSEAPPL